VVDTIACGDVGNVEWIHVLKASNVKAILIRIGATLMMRIDSAVGAEVVLRGHRIELI
jgi:hypothetical protein